MKKSLRQFVADNIHSLIFLAVLLFILIVGLIVRSVIRSHMTDPILDGNDITISQSLE